MDLQVRDFIVAVTKGVSQACEKCGAKLPLLLVTPCAHMLCPDCLHASGDFCEICNSYFDWNALQTLQPGFEAEDFVFARNAASLQRLPNTVLSEWGVGDENYHNATSLLGSKALYVMHKVSAVSADRGETMSVFVYSTKLIFL